MKDFHGGDLVSRIELLPIFFFALVYLLDDILLLLV